MAWHLPSFCSSFWCTSIGLATFFPFFLSGFFFVCIRSLMRRIVEVVLFFPYWFDKRRQNFGRQWKWDDGIVGVAVMVDEWVVMMGAGIFCGIGLVGDSKDLSCVILYFYFPGRAFSSPLSLSLSFFFKIQNSLYISLQFKTTNSCFNQIYHNLIFFSLFVTKQAFIAGCVCYLLLFVWRLYIRWVAKYDRDLAFANLETPLWHFP